MPDHYAYSVFRSYEMRIAFSLRCLDSMFRALISRVCYLLLPLVPHNPPPSVFYRLVPSHEIKACYTNVRKITAKHANNLSERNRALIATSSQTEWKG
jgi:hypothetical protein